MREEQTLKIELLSQWKLEAEFRNYQYWLTTQVAKFHNKNQNKKHKEKKTNYQYLFGTNSGLRRPPLLGKFPNDSVKKGSFCGMSI